MPDLSPAANFTRIIVSFLLILYLIPGSSSSFLLMYADAAKFIMKEITPRPALHDSHCSYRDGNDFVNLPVWSICDRSVCNCKSKITSRSNGESNDPFEFDQIKIKVNTKMPLAYETMVSPSSVVLHMTDLQTRTAVSIMNDHSFSSIIFLIIFIKYSDIRRVQYTNNDILYYTVYCIMNVQ